MPLLDYVSPDDTDDHIRELLAEWSSEYDKRSLLREVLSNNPDVLRAWSQYFHALMHEGNLEPELKEYARTAVSQANRCQYCASSHGETMVETYGIPEERVRAIAEDDFTDFSDRERVVVEFAKQIATDPKRVSERHIDDLLQAGFEESDVIELLVVSTNAIAANTVADALNVHPEDRGDDLNSYYYE